MAKNTSRFDLSDYLIHFFRKVKIDSANAPPVPESMGFGNIDEDVNWSAIFMLRCAIRHNRLWATWSYRNDKRTIYGPSPAVCFTEMPLAAFLEAGSTREARGEAMSQYALVFPKVGLFSMGAKPVIYGLDNLNAYVPAGINGKARILSNDLLPEMEQYRYVTFNPSSNRPVDWSHEREWRWPYRGSLAEYEKELEESGIVSHATDIPGLDLTSAHCRGMGVVVKTKEEAKWVASDILTLVDRGVIDKSHYRFILHADTLRNLEVLRDPKNVTRAIGNSMVDLQPFFSVDKKTVKKLNEEFTNLVLSVENLYPYIESGEFGGAWLWILDNTHDLTRSLIASGRITVSNVGKYLVALPELDDGRSLRQREAIIKKISRQVKTKFGVECGYFSVLDSGDCNEVPFYCDDHLDNRMYFNVSWK